MWHAWERVRYKDKCVRFLWESLKDRDHLEDQHIDEIEMDRREIGWEDVEWNHPAQDRDQ
jgi:hypothetical protein